VREGIEKPILNFLLATALILLTATSGTAQSLTQTVEAIEKAQVTTRILFITAHPDDEWPGLLTYLSHGRGADVALLTLTRGQGGQNALGPEQGDEMGILRTQELLNADKIYGVRQFFTRAPDFGYSKSADETLKIWGEIPLEDMVRVIRTFRPQIVINGWGGVHGGHGQHQASGILTPRAVTEAADPKALPSQIAEGLHPWQTPLVLQPARGEPRGALRIPSDEISPLLGKSYNEIGIEGRSQHRSQGTAADAAATFFRRPIYLEVAGGPSSQNHVELLDLVQPITSLAARFPSLRGRLEPGLRDVDQTLKAARQEALEMRWQDAAKDLARAGRTINLLEAQLSSGPSGEPTAETAEASWELARERDKINTALGDALALHIEARADRYELVSGEDFTIRVEWNWRGGWIEGGGQVALDLPTGWRVTKQETGPPDASSVRFTVSIPADAKRPDTPAGAVLPELPPLVDAAYTAKVDGYAFTMRTPVVTVQANSTEVLTYPLSLVPAVSLIVEPRQIMLQRNQSAKPVELLARVRYHGTPAADIAAGFDAPEGWSVTPVAPIHFPGSEDQLVRFTITPPVSLRAGAYSLKPYARLGSKTFRDSIEALPSLPTRSWMHPADATVHILDLAVPADLSIGYVAAENEMIPDLLRQLGIRVELLDETALTFGDLSRYDAIVVGITAYELRPDVAHANTRLLDYVRQGGTLVVQYEHPDTWNHFHPAPFPASMNNSMARTVDENSPVRFAAPNNPLLNFPNKITASDFEGWVQERGLYYWDQFDPYYQAVLALRDPGEGEELGSLVYARDGKGVYIYTGLSFFRQLPAGVPGAYRLFVNLLSQSKAPAVKQQASVPVGDSSSTHSQDGSAGKISLPRGGLE
jgi:LmbE family N-acetylglucosaminyl deacetylase